MSRNLLYLFMRVCVGIYHVIMCFTSDDRWVSSESDLVNVSVLIHDGRLED